MDPAASPVLLGSKSVATLEALKDAFDTVDSQWQANENFTPDKESTWSHPAEKDGWMLAHNAIRGEIADCREALHEMVQRGSLEQWEIVALRAIWSAHAEHVHAHHSNEDEKMNPFLSSRIKLPSKLEAHHVELVKQMDEIGKLVDASHPSLVDLQNAWIYYEAIMLPHLAEEERIALPLMRAYFTPQEIGPVVQDIVSKGPPVEMGSFIHYAGDAAFFDFMKQEGIPGFVWYLEFKSKRNLFQQVFKRNVEALVAGTPPPLPANSFFCC